MATPIAGKSSVTSVSAAGSAYTTVGGVNQMDLGENRELLDDTEQGDLARSKFAGLLDEDWTITVDLDLTDAGQVILDTAYTGGTSVFIKEAWNGTTGQIMKSMVESRKSGTGVGDKVTRTYSGKGILTPTTF